MAMAINEHGLAMIGSQESLGAQLVATAIWRGQGSLFRWDIIALLRNEGSQKQAEVAAREPYTA